MTMPISPMSSTTGPSTAPPRRTSTAARRHSPRRRPPAARSRGQSRAGSRRSSGRRPRRRGCASRSAGRPSCPRGCPAARRWSPRRRPRGAGRSCGRTPGRAGSRSRSAGTGCSRRLRLRRPGRCGRRWRRPRRRLVSCRRRRTSAEPGYASTSRAGALGVASSPGRPASLQLGLADRLVAALRGLRRPRVRLRGAGAGGCGRPGVGLVRARGGRLGGPCRLSEAGMPVPSVDSGARVASWLGQLSISRGARRCRSRRRARPVARATCPRSSRRSAHRFRRRRRCLLVRCRLGRVGGRPGSRPLRRPVAPVPLVVSTCVRLLRPV